MTDMATIGGGGHHHHRHHDSTTSLSPAEQQAAINALSKLGSALGALSGISSVLGGALRSATLSGGGDTFSGGVRTGFSATIQAIGSDTVVAGSAFGKTELSKVTGGKSGTLNLSYDTINIAGVTASSIKTDTLVVKPTGIKITMSDKTSITLTGVTTHDLKH